MRMVRWNQRRTRKKLVEGSAAAVEELKEAWEEEEELELEEQEDDESLGEHMDFSWEDLCFLLLELFFLFSPVGFVETD